MNQEDLTSGAAALQAAISNAATTGGQTINSNAGQLAPGLATGTNAPGGYNYERSTGPTATAMSADIVLQTKQQILKDVLKDAVYAANDNLSSAQMAYRNRQRKYYRDQALLAEQRFQKQQSDAAAAVAAQNAASKTIATGQPVAPAVVAKTAPANNMSTGAGGVQGSQVNTQATVSPVSTFNPQQTGQVNPNFKLTVRR